MSKARFRAALRYQILSAGRRQRLVNSLSLTGPRSRHLKDLFYVKDSLRARLGTYPKKLAREQVGLRYNECIKP